MRRSHKTSRTSAALNQNLLEAVRRFIQRARDDGQAGTLMTDAEAVDLLREAGGHIPRWYPDLLTKAPLIGLNFSFGEIEDGFRQCDWNWSGAAGIKSECECYPGLPLLERGYFGFASDVTGSGGSLFLQPQPDGEAVIYQVLHDVNIDADEILAGARNQLAPTLAAFLDAACFDE